MTLKKKKSAILIWTGSTLFKYDLCIIKGTSITNGYTCMHNDLTNTIIYYIMYTTMYNVHRHLYCNNENLFQILSKKQIFSITFSKISNSPYLLPSISWTMKRSSHLNPCTQVGQWKKTQLIITWSRCL